jgi:hypothetical protein
MKLRRTETKEALKRSQLTEEANARFKLLEEAMRVEEGEAERAREERGLRGDYGEEERARLNRNSMEIKKVEKKVEAKEDEAKDDDDGDLDAKLKVMEAEMDELFVVATDDDKIEKFERKPRPSVGSAARELALKYTTPETTTTTSEREGGGGGGRVDGDAEVVVNDLSQFKMKGLSSLTVDRGRGGGGSESDDDLLLEGGETEKAKEKEKAKAKELSESESIAKRRRELKNNYVNNTPKAAVVAAAVVGLEGSYDEGDEVPLPIPVAARPSGLAIERAKAAKARREAALKKKGGEG